MRTKTTARATRSKKATTPAAKISSASKKTSTKKTATKKTEVKIARSTTKPATRAAKMTGKVVTPVTTQRTPLLGTKKAVASKKNTKNAAKSASKTATKTSIKSSKTATKTPTTKTAKAAADFSLTDRNGKSYSLNSFKGKWTVLYFYPKDDTPGCTVEAIEFEALLAKFKKAKADVVGLSGGDDKSKAKFCKKHGLSFPLLSDTNFKVSKAYGAYGKKTFMGRTFNGILRKTFILDAKKKIVKSFDTVKPEIHAKEVLTWITSQK